MAAMYSKEDLRHNDSSKATPSRPKDQATDVTSEKKSVGKECPTCKGSGCIQEPAKPKTVDIDAEVIDTHHQLPVLPSPLPKPHREFVHCMPPEPPTYRKFSVFTAGSIEMGKAVQWQKQMVTMLSPLPITVNNPRRGQWDPDATQEARNEAFREQVEWELSALEQADVICFFFDCTTMSPVTMLELGLWAASDKVIVCCDKRFWRAGNVHIVCERYGIPSVDNFEDLVPAVRKMLEQKGMQLENNGDIIGENEHVEKPKPKKKTQLEAEKEDLQRQIDALEAQLANSKV
ncbi:hypothetical protein EJ02DRAFT_453112 [Clathrospora elynae]|uniref:Uncharacterized protein n=1 Tax=Clathrospora elynae TaxID=706981 RepID=A0A6A5SYL8_9PLEO|nr:hypothetical protein EJ02DRAFT_453112 [Clathrospora elynae]